MDGQFYSYTKIFTAPVSAKSKLVYIYLCRMADRSAQCFPSRKTIAAACSCSVESVKRAMRELVLSGLIRKEEQFKGNGRQTSNRYTVIRESDDHYFYCSNHIFDYEISTGAKLVFLYICRCADHTTCYPAYGRIASKCGLSVSHARACIRELENLGLIQKANQYRKNGGRTNNLYTLSYTALVGRTSDSATVPDYCPITHPKRIRRRSSGFITHPVLDFKTLRLTSFVYLCSPPYDVCAPP